MSDTWSPLLVRYGVIAEVVRAGWSGDNSPSRGVDVVIQTPRGEQVGTVLQVLKKGVTPTSEPEFQVLRELKEEDRISAATARERSAKDFETWQNKIAEWGLALELLDCEWTLDGSGLILYVMGGRGAETTRLSLNAVGCGADYVRVQPVDHSGPVPVETGGGGCGDCGCSH